MLPYRLLLGTYSYPIYTLSFYGPGSSTTQLPLAMYTSTDIDILCRWVWLNDCIAFPYEKNVSRLFHHCCSFVVHSYHYIGRPSVVSLLDTPTGWVFCPLLDAADVD